MSDITNTINCDQVSLQTPIKLSVLQVVSFKRNHFLKYCAPHILSSCTFSSRFLSLYKNTVYSDAFDVDLHTVRGTEAKIFLNTTIRTAIMSVNLNMVTYRHDNVV